MSISGAGLSAVLSEISKLCKVNIVADGDEPAKKIDLSCKDTLHNVLDRVCDLFDYEWRDAAGGKAILLTKRFKDPRSQPQLHAAELRQTARDMMTLLGSFSGGSSNPPWGVALVDLWRSLSPAQSAQLANGQTIPFSDLSAQQQDLVASAVAKRGFGDPESYWEREWFLMGQTRYSAVRATAQPEPGGQTDSFYLFYVTQDRLGHALSIPLGPLERPRKP